MLVVTVGNVYSQIFGEMPERIHEILGRDLSFYRDGYVHTYAYKEGRWDGRVRLYQPGKPFYTGLLGSALDRLKQNGISFRVKDVRERVEGNCPEIRWDPPEGYEERPYQDDAVTKSVEVTRGLLDIATGGGKTVVVADIIGRIRVKPFLFYVQSRDLMHQAIDTLQDYLHIHVGQIGDRKIDIRDVNVVMQQLAVRSLHLDEQFNANAYKYDEIDLWDEEEILPDTDMQRVAALIKEARGLYFDECVAGSSEITTEHGSQTMLQGFASRSEFVKTRDENKTVMRRIVKWWKHERRSVVTVYTRSGKSLTCTSDHTILTKSGWKRVRDMKIGEKVLVANAGVEGQEGADYICSIKWDVVVAIEETGVADVFDIEVEGVHCFFANEFLVHNCHHAASATCKDVLSASERAYWRYGGTATLEREDGEDLFIQALFGRKIVEVPAEYLVKAGYLVPAGVFFVPVTTQGLQSEHYGTVYKHAVVNNDEVAAMVADTAQYMASLGYSNLILVTQINHGKRLKKLIPNSEFLTGKDTSTKRKRVINEVRDGHLKILIATSLADEGLDIKCLTAVHMVGSGASITRVPQRIGRVMRPFPSKNFAVAIYYHYVTQFLSRHGNRVKRMLNHNKAYDYIQCDGVSSLKPKLLQYVNQHTSLFGGF